MTSEKAIHRGLLRYTASNRTDCHFWLKTEKKLKFLKSHEASSKVFEWDRRGTEKSKNGEKEDEIEIGCYNPETATSVFVLRRTSSSHQQILILSQFLE